MKSIPPQGADAPAVAPRLLLVALFAITLVAAAAWYLLQTDDGATDTGVDERLTPVARELTTAIETAVSPYREAAAALSTDTEVRGALAALERGSLAALAAAKRPALPELLALRLLPAHPRSEMDTHPPLSFASISWRRRAREEARDPPLEAHLIGTADEHLVLLTRVEEPAGNLVGFVHLSLDPDLVRAPLRTAAPASAYAELRQGAKVRLAASGRAPPVEAPATSVPVRGTTFVVALKAAGRAPAAQRPGVPPLVWLVALLVALLLGAVVVWQRRPAVRVGEPLDDGSVIYQGAIKAILDGVYPGLEQLLPRAQTGSGNVALADLVELDRAEGEDVTTFNVPGTVPPPEEAPPLTVEQSAATDERSDSADFFFLDEEPAAQAAISTTVPAAVFRGYDIRGIVGETLTEEGIYLIGRAIGAEAEARGQRTVVVARDGRHSSVSLQQALTKGLLESGREVLDIGLVPTPVLYFATHFLDARSGVMVTGSHNPAAYNGLKIVLDGETLCGEAIQAIRNRVDTRISWKAPVPCRPPTSLPSTSGASARDPGHPRTCAQGGGRLR